MIQLIDDLPDGTLGFRCSGRISGDDMLRQVIPHIEAGLLEHDRIKGLVVFEPDFAGFSLEAAWDDVIVGVRHWDGFERLALITDLGWLRQGLRAVALLLPCPVRLFALTEGDEARRWLSESLGTVHLQRQGDVITISLIGQLDQAAYGRIDADLDGLFSEVEQPRVLLDLRQFDGWLGLSALGQHLALLRDHRHHPQRLAVVTSQPWQHLAQRLVRPFSKATMKTFAGLDLVAAQEWIATN